MKTGDPDVHPLPQLTRRSFVVQGGCSIVATTLAIGGCASVGGLRLTPVEGRLELPLAQHPELTTRDGALRVQVPGEATPIYILVTGERQYAAVSPVCTHLGCTVEIQGTHLVCPCHGSTYERTGRVVRGPAERPLRRFAANVRNDVLVIDLAAPGGANG